MLEKGWNLAMFLFLIHKAEPLSLLVILQWPFWGWHGSFYGNHVGRCSAPCKHYLVFFFFFFIVLQSKILYNLVAGQLPMYICPSLNCLLSLHTDFNFPLFLCFSQPNSCRVQLPCDSSMWLLVLILEAPLTSSPQPHCLAPKESPHFILLLKVKS